MTPMLQPLNLAPEGLVKPFGVCMVTWPELAQTTSHGPYTWP